MSSKRKSWATLHVSPSWGDIPFDFDDRGHKLTLQPFIYVFAKCLIERYSISLYIFIVHFIYCGEIYCSDIGVHRSLRFSHRNLLLIFYASFKGTKLIN